MKQCRIMVTTRCNLQCSYCLMKNKQLMSTIRPIGDISEILAHKYSSYCITGGEPLCDYLTISKTLLLADAIRANAPGKPIYLYTNGMNLVNIHRWIVGHKNSEFFDGVNISPHHKIVPYKKILRVNKYIPVRLHRRDVMVTPEFVDFCAKYKIPYRIWQKDKCVTVPEDRFLLK